MSPTLLHMTAPVETDVVETVRGAFGVRTQGQPGDPVVILAHGFPDDASTFDALGGRLARSGYRVLAPYLRGYAPSTLEPPYGVTSLAEDLMAIADEASPNQQVFLIGHDTGALAVYRALYLAPHRIKRAVTLGLPHPETMRTNAKGSAGRFRRSRYFMLFQVPGLAEWWLRRSGFSYVDRLWKAWSPGFTPEPAHLEQVKRTLNASMPKPLLHYRTKDFRPPPLSSLIATPTLHLHGSRDGAIPASLGKGQEKKFRGPFTSEVVLEAGRWVHLEQPDRVAARILAWLRATSTVRDVTRLELGLEVGGVRL